MKFCTSDDDELFGNRLYKELKIELIPTKLEEMCEEILNESIIFKLNEIISFLNYQNIDFEKLKLENPKIYSNLEKLFININDDFQTMKNQISIGFLNHLLRIVQNPNVLFAFSSNSIVMGTLLKIKEEGKLIHDFKMSKISESYKINKIKIKREKTKKKTLNIKKELKRLQIKSKNEFDIYQSEPDKILENLNINDLSEDQELY